MLRLHILRHANTAWALPGQLDIERNLNEQGMEDLQIVAGWIGKHDIAPGHVYCSTAARTRATLAGIVDRFEPTPGIDYVEAFYNGYTDEYLETVRRHPNSEDLMLVGHNPTCASLVSMLISKEDIEGTERVAYSFPAGALATVEFYISNWEELKPYTGRLTNFLIPRQSQRFEG